MKKLLSLTLIVLCVFSLASCFGNSDTTCAAHKDYDGNMYCDLCGAIYVCPDHCDADSNGACDTCGSAYTCSGHADANKDGKCDKCKANYRCPGHRDTAADGKCDICSAMFICEHIDSNSDQVCDKCRAYFNCLSHQDLNADGFCDFCEAEYVCTDHRDTDANSVCDTCGESYTCPGHIDADGDGKCDECSAFGSALNEVNPKSVAAFIRAFNNSLPTKTTTETTITVGSGKDSYVLSLSSSLVTGNIAGKNAAIYEESKQELNSVDAGSGDTIINVFKTTTEKREYLQGRGLRVTVDGVRGSFDSKGTNFAPSKGDIMKGMKITEENIKVKSFTIEENLHIMEFTVSKANAQAVFGMNGAIANVAATSDVNVTLTSNGATITSIVITYKVNATKDVPAQEFVIEAKYDYSIQNITIK